jgi:hypothetical protein
MFIDAAGTPCAQTTTVVPPVRVRLSLQGMFARLLFAQFVFPKSNLHKNAGARSNHAGFNSNGV